MNALENHFGIPDADQLFCSVWQYRPHHSFLKIKIYGENPKTLFWLTFTMPVYMRCPMFWKGANFRLATPAEVLEFQSDGFFQDVHVKEYQLFLAEVDHDSSHPNRIQILALDGKLKQEE